MASEPASTIPPCTSTIIDRATGNPTRCALPPEHEGRHDDGALSWGTIDDPGLRALALLQELLDKADDENYENADKAPVWLFNLVNKARGLVRPK